jgi:hypothetical protein
MRGIRSEEKEKTVMNGEVKQEKREDNKNLFEAEKCSDPLGFL